MPTILKLEMKCKKKTRIQHQEKIIINQLIHFCSITGLRFEMAEFRRSSNRSNKKEEIGYFS